jgi:hypothetical protein
VKIELRRRKIEKQGSGTNRQSRLEGSNGETDGGMIKLGEDHKKLKCWAAGKPTVADGRLKRRDCRENVEIGRGSRNIEMLRSEQNDSRGFKYQTRGLTGE